MRLDVADSEVLCAPLGALPARFRAMPAECSSRGKSKGAACRALSKVVQGNLGSSQIRQRPALCLRSDRWHAIRGQALDRLGS